MKLSKKQKEHLEKCFAEETDTELMEQFWLIMCLEPRKFYSNYKSNSTWSKSDKFIIGGLNEIEIVKLYKKLNMTELSKKYNCSRTKIKNILKKHKIYKYTPNNLNENIICELYKNGSTISEISKKFSCNPSKISKILKENNILINLYNKKHLDEKLIIELYKKKKLTVSQIAKKFNCNRKPIDNILDRYKIKKTDARFKYFTRKQVRNWIEDIENGKSKRQLCKDIGCDKATLNKYIKKYHAGELE